MNLYTYIQDVPDFPKPGIIFKDIAPLLASPEATAYAVQQLCDGLHGKIDQVVGIESRGFLLGILIAQELGVGFTLSRKRNKLPGKLISQSYDLEYGTDELQMQAGAIVPGARVLLHDDVLATGGTAAAAVALIEKMGGNVVQCNFLMELDFLKGSERLTSEVRSLIHY